MEVQQKKPCRGIGASAPPYRPPAWIQAGSSVTFAYVPGRIGVSTPPTSITPLTEEASSTVKLVSTLSTVTVHVVFSRLQRRAVFLVRPGAAGKLAVFHGDVHIVRRDAAGAVRPGDRGNDIAALRRGEGAAVKDHVRGGVARHRGGLLRGKAAACAGDGGGNGWEMGIERRVLMPDQRDVRQLQHSVGADDRRGLHIGFEGAALYRDEAVSVAVDRSRAALVGQDVHIPGIDRAARLVGGQAGGLLPVGYDGGIRDLHHAEAGSVDTVTALAGGDDLHVLHDDFAAVGRHHGVRADEPLVVADDVPVRIRVIAVDTAVLQRQHRSVTPGKRHGVYAGAAGLGSAPQHLARGDRKARSGGKDAVRLIEHRAGERIDRAVFRVDAALIHRRSGVGAAGRVLPARDPIEIQTGGDA